MKTLYFVETEEDVRLTERLLQNASGAGEHKVMALSPAAMHLLDTKKIPYSMPEGYYRQEELNAIGLEYYKRVEDFCRYLDLRVKERLASFGEHDISPAFFHYRSFKIIFDAMIIRIFSAEKVLLAERPDAVYCFYSRDLPIDPSLFFKNGVHLYGRVIPLVAAKLKIPVRREPAKNRSYVRQVVRSAVEDLKVLANVSIKRYLSDYPKGGTPAPSRSLFVITDGYDLKIMIQGICKRALYRLYFWNPIVMKKIVSVNPFKMITPKIQGIRQIFSVLSREIETLWEHLKKDQCLRRCFIYSDVDFFSVMESRFKYFLFKCVPDTLAVHLRFEDFLSKNPVSAVLSITLMNYAENAIADVARKNGVPVITYQLGAYGSYFNPIVFYQGMAYTDHAFLYGEGIVRHFEEHYAGRRARLFPIGSAALDHVVRNRSGREDVSRRFGLSGDKKTVIYVPTALIGNLRYVDIVNYADNIYFENQKAIVRTLKEFSDRYQIVIKLCAGKGDAQSPIRGYIESIGFQGCKIYQNCPYTDLLPAGDLFIFDLASTAFLQTLTTDKPVIVYNGTQRFDALALETLKSCVEYTDDISVFTRTIRRCLEDGIPGKECAGRSDFLKLYGTHLNDGKSMERAISALEKIAAGSL